MPRNFALERATPVADRISPNWRLPLAQVALGLAAVLLLFAGTWFDMARQWWDSSTYNHILLVPFIIVWLVAIRARELASLQPEAWRPGLIWCAGAVFCWLVGDISGVSTASHLGVVLLLQGLVLALLGPRIAAALAFPLFYAFFLVPIGDEFVPTLQMITARQVIALTGWSGIPAHIDGVFIDTPAGLFEVAEACSGVKFLVAMIALGALVAHLCFRSWTRRAVFMTGAIVLPVLANSVRAWATIWIAQSQGIEFAAGFDHILYGWVFFALVMGALLAAGWRFFDRAPTDSFVDHVAIERSSFLQSIGQHGIDRWKAFAAILALILGALGWAHAARVVAAPLPGALELSEVSGWQRVDYQPAVAWEPRATGAEKRVIARFRDADGRSVDVFYALYARQGEGSEAGAFGEGALVPDTQWRWASNGPVFGDSQSETLQANGQHKRLAVTFYRHGPMFGGSRAKLKLATLLDRIRLKAEPTAMLIVSSEDEDALGAVGRFVDAATPLDAWMDRAAQNP